MKSRRLSISDLPATKSQLLIRSPRQRAQNRGRHRDAEGLRGLEVAKALGLTFPLTLLGRADEAIDQPAALIVLSAVSLPASGISLHSSIACQ
jgi:hypothetical protein